MVSLLRKSHSEHLAVRTVTRMKAQGDGEHVNGPVPGVRETEDMRRWWLPGVEGMGVLRWTRMVLLLLGVGLPSGVLGGAGPAGLGGGVGVVTRGMVEILYVGIAG